MGHILGLAGGALIVAVVAWYLLVGVVGLGSVFVDGYRAFRYDRRGLCYQCKQPFTSTTTAPRDQMFGPDTVSQSSCKCGTVSLIRGQRRFAEW